MRGRHFRNVPPPRMTTWTDAPSPDQLDPAEERFTFFWRGPFSQWHPSRFVIDGVTYTHAEQYMMAEKARLFGDRETLAMIMKASNPKEQKALGKKVRGFVEEMWQQEVRPILFRGNRAKFSQNERLMELLLETEGTTLVEASPYDQIYGIGLAENDPRAKSRATWRGQNVLGDVLTKLRDEFLLELRPAPTR